MRWAILGLALLLGVVGLLYRGGVAFVSSLSDATASRGVDAPATVVAPTGQVEAPTGPERSPDADPMSASDMRRPAAAPAPQPTVASNPEDSSPSASEQRSFSSRKALETIDPREFLRQTSVPK